MLMGIMLLKVSCVRLHQEWVRIAGRQVCNWKPFSLNAETISKMKQLVCANLCIAFGKVGCEVGILYA